MAKNLFTACAVVALFVLAAGAEGFLLFPDAKKNKAPVNEHKGLNKPRFHYKYEDGTQVDAGLGATTAGYAPCDPDVTQRSGYFNINAGGSYTKDYFFWGFEAKTNPSTAPMILWMTGGPGCSSGLAVLSENGPCKVDEHLNVYANPYSWNNVANIIYIDQPAGVGYSKTSSTKGLDHNESQVGEDMYHFMQAFYTAYPEFLQNELFVYGESYGGHFAPATAYRFFQGNQRNEGPNRIPLRGLSTGNGLTAPTVQYKYYTELSYDWCKTVKGTPCVSESVHQTMEAEKPKCLALLDKCNSPSGTNADCLAAFESNSCNIQIGAYQETGLNVYDIRHECHGPLCYNFTAETDFFNLLNVQQALGVTASASTMPRKWELCNFTVNGMFGADWSHDFNQLVPPMMENGIRVLVYAGDMDFICNWLGNQAWTLDLPWANKTAFNAAAPQPWYLDEVPAGRVRHVSSVNNTLQFSFVQVHGAGHMVPMNQPARALDMVKHFLGDTIFSWKTPTAADGKRTL